MKYTLTIICLILMLHSPVMLNEVMALTIVFSDGDTGQGIQGAHVKVIVPDRWRNSSTFHKEITDIRTDRSGQWYYDFSRKGISKIESITVIPESNRWFAYMEVSPSSYEQVPGKLQGPGCRGRYMYQRGTLRKKGYLDGDVIHIKTYRIGSGKYPHAALNTNNYDHDDETIASSRDSSLAIQHRPLYDRDDPDDDNDGILDYQDRDQFSGIESKQPVEYGYRQGRSEKDYGQQIQEIHKSVKNIESYRSSQSEQYSPQVSNDNTVPRKEYISNSQDDNPVPVKVPEIIQENIESTNESLIDTRLAVEIAIALILFAGILLLLSAKKNNK